MKSDFRLALMLLAVMWVGAAAAQEPVVEEGRFFAQPPNEAKATGTEAAAEDMKKQAAVEANRVAKAEAARLRAEQKARMSGEPAQAAAVTAESKQAAEAARLKAEQKARMSGEPAQEASAAGERKVQLSLKTLGFQTPLKIFGADAQSGVDFSFHTVDIVERLRFKVRYSYSPTLNSEASYLKVMLNGHEVGVLTFPRDTARDAQAVLEIDPLLLQEWNRLSFQFVSHMEKPLCDDPRNSLLWVELNHRDTIIEADANTLPVADDLTLFPVPFFDKHDVRDLTLPFVFSERPSWATLRSAGILTSWFGSKADWRKVRFPSHLNAIPERDAIVLATSQDHIDGIDLPAVTNGVATVSIIRNPRNPNTNLLLVVGRNEDGLIQAAQAITLGQVKLAGAQQDVHAVNLPKRVPFDSPGWLPIDKKLLLGDIVPPERLVSSELFVAPLEMVLRLPPNLYRAETAFIPFDLKFLSSNNSRYLIRVDALFNGVAFQHETFSKPKAYNSASMLGKHVLLNIPTRDMTGKDTITVKFTFADKKHEMCNTAVVKDEIRIDPNSTIDLTDPLRYVELPNLSYLAVTGYPFSKLADLSETAVLMPDAPDHYEIESMLTTLGHIGNKTGFPATSVSVSSIRDVNKFADKDILVVGSTGRVSSLLEKWKSQIQVNLLSDEQPFPHFGARYLQRLLGWVEVTAKFLHEKGKNGMVMVGFESPLQSKRSVVVLTAMDSSSLPKEASMLNTLKLSKDFFGDVAVISESNGMDHVIAFERSLKYAIGGLSLREHARNFVRHNPWSGVFLGFLISLLFASMTYRRLKRKSEEKLSRDA